VLTALTLFMLLGAVTLTMSTRARQTARASAKAMAGTAAGPMKARVQLEEALLRLIRGKPAGDTGEGDLDESLLADMYGSQDGFAGEVTSLVPQDGSPLVRATVTITGELSGSASTARLSGRILTLKPASGSGDAVTSYRVLRAEGTGPFTCWLVGTASQAKKSLPKLPCPILVNPPAFRDEAYDAFDDSNKWLTQLELKDGAVVHVPRPAYAEAGTPAEVDNDNDGVLDGIWKRNFLASTPAPGALGELEYDVSYLVMDLDGRVNVNAHGNRTSIDYPSSDTRLWEGAPDVPVGSGFGPADVDASLMFTGSGSLASTGSSVWKRTLGEAGVGSVTGTASTPGQRRLTPQVGVVQGRYGEGGKPGVANQNDPGSQRSEMVHTYTNPATGTSAYFDPVADPKAMIKVEMVASGTSPMPKLQYFLPDFNRDRLRQASGLGTSAKDADLVTYYTQTGAALHFVDDPYEMQLHDDAPWPMELTADRPSHRDNPFTAAELEAVLRQFDADAGTLPPRLLASLDNLSQRSRSLITTDSWDTPAITGAVAGQVADYAANLEDPASPLMLEDPVLPLMLEAENGDLEGVSIGPDVSDYSRTKYVTGFDQASDKVSWLFPTAKPGTYSMDLCCRTGSDSKGLNGFLNGLPFSEGLNSSGTSFTIHSKGSFKLLASNTLTISGTNFDIDFVKLTPQKKVDPTTLLSPDVLAGLRFDINRPFPKDDPITKDVDEEIVAKQEFCKHLYMLLVALGQPPNRDTAQWAANVLDYRDPDSVFTKFEFDTNPQDGWTPNEVVWGVERPELVIAQTVAWRTNKTDTQGNELKDISGNPIIADGGLYVSLYRPWNTEVIGSGAANGSNKPLQMSVERLDPALAATGDSSLLDLGNYTPTASGTSKGSQKKVIWRLRFDDDQGAAKYVKFDSPANNIDGEGFRSNVKDELRRMKPDSYLVVMPNPPKGASTPSVNTVNVPSVMTQFAITQPATSAFRAEQWGGAGNEQPGADTMVYLERIADPSKAYDPTTNPYVIVDKLGVKVVNRTGAYNSGQSSGPNNWRYYFRDPPFWRHRPFSHLNKELDTSGNTKNPSIKTLDADATSWLPWANRPYVSHAELMLVPRGDSLEMLTQYDIPQKPGFKCAACGGDGILYETPSTDPSTPLTEPCTSCQGTGKTIAGMLPYYHLPTPTVLDATMVPSRFAGSRLSVNPSGLTAVGMDKIPYDQISRWREPGRVNLNTVLPNRECTDPDQDDAVWHAIIGDDAAVSRDEFAAAGPAKTLAEMLTLLRDDAAYINMPETSSDPVRGKSWKKNRLYQMNPALAYATAIRLANVATIRSHVFAVWITLRVRDTTPGSHDSYHRLFAIVDRSRPAGYKKGQNLNVREVIRVVRYLD
jgi:hypothetical protein